MKKNIFVGKVLGVLLICIMLLVGCSETKSVGDVGDSDNKSDSNTSIVYMVVLDPNGGIFPDGTKEKVTLEVREGEAVDFVTYMPALEGNELRGWYQEDASAWPGARIVTGDLKLKARWSEEVLQEVLPLTLELKGEEVPVTSDSGVYQFTVVSSIYGGYAQRSGMYTIYLDELKASIAADDGSTKRALLKVGSSYKDATGYLYALMYNDGTMELYYEYEYNGEITKYVMDTVYWTLDAFTPPYAAETILEEGISAHAEYDMSFIMEESSTESMEVTADDVVAYAGESFISIDSMNSETMKLQFSTNGTASIYMTTYEMNIETKYLWKYNEESGLFISYNGAIENSAIISEDGQTCTIVDSYDNTYEFSVADFISAIPEREEILRFDSSNTDTMFAFVYRDNGIDLMYDLTSYGQEGQYYATSEGQWMFDEENGLQVAFDGKVVDLTEDENGDYVFTLDDNTYVIVLSELLNALN